MDASAGFARDFVGRVLNELEELPVAVSALCDAAFTVGVLGDKAGIHGVCLQDSG
nr:hypothetical protein [Streptomyces parvulus]